MDGRPDPLYSSSSSLDTLLTTLLMVLEGKFKPRY
jgi:hypothetical protein